MKEDTLSKRVKYGLQKTADTLHKHCDSLKQQVKKVRENICERTGKIVDEAKRRGRLALYKVAEVMGIRKTLFENRILKKNCK